MLIESAAELVRGGGSPSVAEVAEYADVSRATAYRYFPTQEMLLAEVALFSVGGPLAPEKPAASGAPADAVGQLVRGVGEWSYDSERALRTLLRLSLDDKNGIERPGHRVEWIAEALGEAREQLGPETYEKLAASLTLLLGIDPIVVMTDIAHLSREQALDTLEWAARTLVDGALAEGRAPKSG